MLSLQVAGHVRHHSEEHGGVVLLDMATGKWLALNRTAGELWRSWDSGAGFEEGVTEVAARHPDVARAAIRADARQLAEDLVTRGLVTVTPPGTAAVMAEPGLAPGGQRPGWLTTAVAWVLLVIASALVKRSFRVSYALVRASRRGWCRWVPTSTQAERAVAAVSRASRHYPGRAACLEQSLAAVLLAAARRWRLDWCVGSAPDPYRFHAWVEVGGKVVAADTLGPESGFTAVLIA